MIHFIVCNHKLHSYMALDFHKGKLHCQQVVDILWLRTTRPQKQFTFEGKFYNFICTLISNLSDIDTFMVTMESGATSSGYLEKVSQKFLNSHIALKAHQEAWKPPHMPLTIQAMTWKSKQAKKAIGFEVY